MFSVFDHSIISLLTKACMCVRSVILAIFTPILTKLGWSLVKYVVKHTCTECCATPNEKVKKEIKMDLMPKAGQGSKSGVDSEELDYSTWAEAAETSNTSPFDAFMQSLARLLFWHLAQPFAYGVVYGCAVAKSEIDGLQVTFGAFVAFREGMYAVMALVCCCLKPAYLMVDVVKSTKGHDDFNDFFDNDFLAVDTGWKFLAMYVLAPEKYVARVLFEKALNMFGTWMIALFVLTCFDLCGLVALIIGVTTGDITVALAIGYSVTTVGLVVVIAIICC